MDNKALLKLLKNNSLLVDGILNSSKIILMAWNMDGKLNYMNNYTQKFTGYLYEELIDKDFYFVFPGDGTRNHLSKIFCSPKKGLTKYLREGRLRCKNGSIKNIIWNNTLIKDDNNNPNLLLTIGFDITEKKSQEKDLLKLAFNDSLTGIPNKKFMIKFLDKLIKKHYDDNSKFAVLFIDIDNFKSINNSCGYEFGDKLLLEVVKILLQLNNNKTEGIFRVEGDEFSVVIPNISSRDEVSLIAEKFKNGLNRPIDIDNYKMFLSVSIGISLFPYDIDDFSNSKNICENLIKKAENALYFIKRRGKNSFKFFDNTVYLDAKESLELENDLRYAIERNELKVFYQPQIDVTTGKIKGLEALLRWFHPVKGLIPPSKFIPIAEESGLISSIGEFVLYSACKQNKLWQDSGIDPIKISVNVSPLQFHQYDLLDTIKNILTETDLSPEYLEIELTESATIRDLASAISTITSLKDLGIKIALDDFGTGYSSLSHVKNLPIDILKMDKSFIDDIEHSELDKNVSAALIFMAHSMKLNVVAEGVETKIQYDFLKEKNCDEIQGYYFSKPLPSEEIEQLLVNN